MCSWITEGRHDHRGCRIVRFDKRSRKPAARELGDQLFRRVGRYFNAYAVAGPDDAVLTVGHRRRRFEKP